MSELTAETVLIPMTVLRYSPRQNASTRSMFRFATQRKFRQSPAKSGKSSKAGTVKARGIVLKT